MSDIRALIKHSSNYLLANLATKALAFISIPVYTRLLTISDYGVVNVFMATVQIATILLTLNTEVAISRFYYDTKDIGEFKKFVGTSIILTGSVFILMSCVTILFLHQLSELSALSENLTLLIIPVALYNIINSVFQQIYNPMMQSRKIAIVSSIQVYLAFGLSVVAMLILSTEKYYGYIYGNICAMLLLAVYLVNNIRPYVKFSLEWKYVKYILSYSLPNLPYALSGLIIAVFGRLIIGERNGFDDAGLYSFAANIGGLMLIIISVTHQAWNPYYFRYMNENDTLSIDKDYNLIWRLSLLGALFLSFFGSDIGRFLGRPQYYSSLYLIPIFTLGYVFYQWAYVYMRNCGYAKKMIWNAIVVVTSGVANVVLSALLIKRLGIIGVAISFTLSYLILLIFSYWVNLIQLKLYAPKVFMFIKPFSLFLTLWILSVVSNCVITEYNDFPLKLLIWLSGAIILLRFYLQQLWKKLKVDCKRK